jgi:aminotransferase in exopolysaccharide biosynthesis
MTEKTLTPQELIAFVQDRFGTRAAIPLHAPSFAQSDRDYVLDCLESTFVSSVGAYVPRFEQEFSKITGATSAVAVVNGTAALHVALRLAGVGEGDLVITQSLSFIATCNAVTYCGAQPLFVDVDSGTLGLSPDAVDELLNEIAVRTESGAIEKSSGRRIRACVPMHTFGHPVKLNELLAVCEDWGVVLIEDAAEALGSLYHGKHVGAHGCIGAYSFNGNKIVTTGGGGMLTFDDAELAAHAKHLTTTAKLPHAWNFVHDEVGYNYRMPNLNAALGCAQLERLEPSLKAKRALAADYQTFFEGTDMSFCAEPPETRSNYWLCTVVCHDPAARTRFLHETNSSGVMTRPVWTPMHQLPIYSDAPRGPLPVTEFLADRLLSLPSSALLGAAPEKA